MKIIEVNEIDFTMENGSYKDEYLGNIVKVRSTDDYLYFTKVGDQYCYLQKELVEIIQELLKEALKSNCNELEVEKRLDEVRTNINEKEIYKKALTKWGSHCQLGMLIEECAELISAVKRFQRGRVGVLDLMEEIADVEIVIGQMRILFDGKMIDVIKEQKLKKLITRLRGEEDV